jgi:hypothetical protein
MYHVFTTGMYSYVLIYRVCVFLGITVNFAMYVLTSKYTFPVYAVVYETNNIKTVYVWLHFTGSGYV